MKIEIQGIALTGEQRTDFRKNCRNTKKFVTQIEKRGKFVSKVQMSLYLC